MTSWIFLVLEWIVFGVVVYAIHKWYYKNRPKPLPKSSMKKDCVLDENSNLFASKAEHYHWRIKTNIKSLRKMPMQCSLILMLCLWKMDMAWD